ncbi:Glycosyl hydrolase [Kalmanozyma brasiliensis GHG001]|uniref:Asl1-like glycosyl hydrolase catalytic domain-containing protein n=1 Tax=Kalmanozyma brasiliensis (strain GHG001) TaxID=1365824 RepID=V5GQV5_KALBG|nr:Glycosyl hydrolase [Kalmanozyma brasiliensis GHG001]EST08332.1 Glycosyl hydrolase [Kalmanozyma brasiliensis GHG001]
MKLGTFATLLAFALVAIVDGKKHKARHGHQRSTGTITSHQLGVPWGCDPSCIKGLKSTGRSDISFYHHWQDTRVPELDALGLDYVPTFWGPSKWDKWNAVKNELNAGALPTYMLAFNEPDVQGQSDVGPQAAARLWMQELKPFADRGVKVGSPQVCWNMQWLQKFMSACQRLGCDISFIAIHWYGSWRDFDKFTAWIESVHDAYGLPIWVTEYGITQASRGTQAQIKDFHIRAVQWMHSVGYVQRSAWLGGFPVDQKPDPYPSAMNSYFNGDGSARDLLWWAANSGGGDYLNLLGKRDVANHTLHDDEIKQSLHPQYDEDHCDYKCQLRQGSIEKHARNKKGIVEVNDGKVCVETPSKLDREERKKLTTCLRQAGVLKSEGTAHDAGKNVSMSHDNEHRHVGTPMQKGAPVESS